MKKFILVSALSLAALSFAGSMVAQSLIPFDFYGFMTKEDVSYDTPKAQQYVVAKMIYTPDSESPYYLQRQTSVFNSKAKIDDEWVKVSSCYMRDGVMYVVRYNSQIGLNRVSTFDALGAETVVADVPPTNGYITHAAYVEPEDMVYMVLADPMKSGASLYKAPAADLANQTYVAKICTNFMDKPYSFTYSAEEGRFFYVTNSAKLYGLSLSGEKDYYYEIHPDNAYLPSDGSDGSEVRYIDACSGLVWAESYNMLIWVCPRGATAGASLTYWYGLELVKQSETPVVHQLIHHTNSGLSNNYFNCMVSQGISVPAGLPPAPNYVSVYTVKDKPGYYDLTWAAVRNDVDGNPIEGEISFDVFIGENLIAQKVQPARGTTVGTRILLPHAYTDDYFYVGVQTITEAGKSSIKEEGPVRSTWDPDNEGGWLDPSSSLVPSAIIDGDLNVTVNGNSLSISGLGTATAQVYTVDGKNVASIADAIPTELPAGLYIITTDTRSFKVILH